MKGCAGDVAWFSSRHMSDPPPSLSHDGGAQAVLVTAGRKMSVGDCLELEYSQDSSKFPGVEGGRLVDVTFSYLPAF